MAKLKLYLQELRAPFLVASMLAVGLGSAVAYCCREVFHPLNFIVSLVGVAFIHAGANVANDYFDKKSGCDDANDEFARPFTGGSRLIQNGLLTPREVIMESLILYIAGAACGIYLSIAVGWWALIIGSIGALCGFFYTAPPIKLVSRGLGEPIVGINFGILVTLGSYYVQAGRLDWAPVYASLPLAVLISAVLYINQFQDARADEKTGKRHWVVRLGKKRAAALFPFLMLVPYAVILSAVAFKVMPAWTLIAFAAAPLSLKAILVASKFHLDSNRLVPANAFTAAAHSAVAILLITGYLLAT